MGQIENTTDVKIKGIACAAPAGNMVLAFFLAVLFIIAAGFVDPSMATVLIPLGFSASIVQTISGIVQLNNDDIMNGNVSLAFSVFTWQASIATLLKILNLMPADTSPIDGWLYLMMGVFMLIFTPFMFKAHSAAALFIVGADVFFMGSAVASIFNIPILGQIGTWALPLCVVSVIWQGAATVLNTCDRRSKISFGPPLIKEKDMNYSSQVD